MPMQQMLRKQRWHGYTQKDAALASGGYEVMITLMDKGLAKVGLGNLDIKGKCLCYGFWRAPAVTRLKSRGIAAEFGI